MANPEDMHSFVMFSGTRGQACIGMPQVDLRRTTGVLHHARGSFTAAAELMVDESPGLEQHHHHLPARIITRLWVPFEIASFLPLCQMSAWDWSEWLNDNHTMSDMWLYGKRHLLQKQFTDKWLVEHSKQCRMCSHIFALGLDGKRGMKRFVCACMNSSKEYIPHLGAWRCQPCPNRPKLGGVYCKERLSTVGIFSALKKLRQIKN